MVAVGHGTWDMRPCDLTMVTPIHPYPSGRAHSHTALTAVPVERRGIRTSHISTAWRVAWFSSCATARLCSHTSRGLVLLHLSVARWGDNPPSNEPRHGVLLGYHSHTREDCACEAAALVDGHAALPLWQFDAERPLAVRVGLL